MYRSEVDLRREYAEFLEEGEDADLLPLIRDLDTGYGLQTLPPQLPRWQLRRLPEVPLSLPPPSRRARAIRRSLVAAASALLAVAVILVGLAASSRGSDPTNLGHQQEVVPRPILGAFHRRGPVITQHGKPVVLFLGTMVEEFSAIERWPLVKALNEFGSFHGVTASTATSCSGTVGTRASPITCFPRSKYPWYATPDLEHATYTSRYVVFEGKDLINDAAQVVPASGVQGQLFHKYMTYSNYMGLAKPTYKNLLWNTVLNVEVTHQFPLISIGGYLQLSIGVALPGDLIVTNSDLPLSYAQVQDSLKTGKSKKGAPPTLVTDVNGEANIITALICHADGKKPSNVCTRPAIKTILKHVK